MPKMITKIAKRFLTGSFLLGAVLLAPRDGCDPMRTIPGPRELVGPEATEQVLSYGEWKPAEFHGPNLNVLLEN